MIKRQKEQMKIKYIIIFGIVIVSLLAIIVFADSTKPKNICIGMNVSIPPFEKFCEDINMKYHIEGFLFWKQSGCIDKNNEIHYYKVSSEGSHWIIGNKSYKMEWISECDEK